MCAHPNPGRTRFAAEELLRRLFQFASVVYLMTGRNKHSVLHQFVHHLAEMPRETQKTSLLSPLGKGNRNVAGTLRSHHAQLLKQALLCCALAAKRRSWISHRNTFSLLGSLSNPRVKKNPSLLGLFGAPQWCCLTSGGWYLSFDEFLLQF